MFKKIILALFTCCIYGVVFSQDETIDRNKEADENVRRTISKKLLDEPAIIDQRTIKYWGNGQKSSPTGRQATGIGSGYSALKQDRPVKIVNPSFNIRKESKAIPENRDIYKWENGQSATITGFQATGIGSGYSALRKDDNYREHLRKTHSTRRDNNSISNIGGNRKIKTWPDGQKATKTGHEATAINGGYSALGKKKSSTNNSETGNK